MKVFFCIWKPRPLKYCIKIIEVEFDFVIEMSYLQIGFTYLMPGSYYK